MPANWRCATPPGKPGGFDSREVTYGWGELDNLVPAYACTIHKSQGSEYPAVVIPLLTQHYAMLQRNLVYTGITRGMQLVVLVGQKKALAMAVKNHLGRRRYTKLAEWLAPSGAPSAGIAQIVMAQPEPRSQQASAANPEVVAG